jgi:uncharacterized membrane protein (DUF485 family)
MSLAELRDHYEHLSNEELLSLAADKEHLLSEAAVALDSEIRRRGLRLQDQIWLREPGSAERVRSLQDYDWYQRLSRKRQSMSRYWYILVIGPFFLVIVTAETFFKNSQLLSVSIVGAALTWALLVIADNLLVIIRWASFKCPQCGHRFGTDAECWSCGFPRLPKQ